MPQITLFPYKVGSSETDMFERLRAGALTAFLIQSAIKSADDLQAGFGELKAQQLFWVLSRITIEIEQPLMWYHTGEIETWPKNVERIFYLRDFLVRGPQNQLVAKATSAWLAVDMNTKRPKNAGGVSEYLSRLKDRHALQTPPEKLVPLPSGEVYAVRSTYFDIDINKHVTASRYLDWMMDTFPIDFHEKNYPKSITINYLNETWINENIEIIKSNSDENTYHFQGQNTDRNLTAFLGKIRF